jgi:uncharacterized protein
VVIDSIIQQDNRAKSRKQPAFLHSSLFIILCAFCLLFRSEDSLLNWILLAVLLAISCYLLLSRATVAIPALFFTLTYIFRISFDLKLGLWLAVPLALYILLTVLVRPWHDSAVWLRWGKPNLRTWILAAVTVVISAVALILWVRLTQPDLSKFSAMLPPDQPWLIICAGLGFATVNALVEEFIFRGILWDGLGRLLSPIWLILAIQAVLFGATHHSGFPNGIWGMALAAIYGALLGIVRHQSKGLGAPVITHFFADLTIFLIIFL